MVRNRHYIKVLRDNRFDGATPGHHSPLHGLMRGLTAAAVALSLVLAAVVPARASDASHDFVKALAAIAAIAIIAQQIGDQRKPRPVPVPVRPKVPAVCAIEIDAEVPVRVFSGRCLRQSGFAYPLPKACAREVRIFGRADLVYGAKCLHGAGYNVGRGVF